MMYYPHEVFNLVGQMKCGSGWKGEYYPSKTDVAGVRLDSITGDLEISHFPAFDQQTDGQLHTDDCLHYIEAIMAAGWVASWVRRNEMWAVYEPTHWQVDDEGDGLTDGNGLRFFISWLEKVMVEGEDPSNDFLIDKSSFDRTLETVGSDVHAFIKRGVRGSGGNTKIHDKIVWKKMIAELLSSDQTFESETQLAKAVVRKLRGTKHPVPHPDTVSNYILFLTENSEL